MFVCHIDAFGFVLCVLKLNLPNASPVQCKGFILNYHPAATVTRQLTNHLNEKLYDILLTKAETWSLLLRV